MFTSVAVLGFKGAHSVWWQRFFPELYLRLAGLQSSAKVKGGKAIHCLLEWSCAVNLYTSFIGQHPQVLPLTTTHSLVCMLVACIGWEHAQTHMTLQPGWYVDSDLLTCNSAEAWPDLVYTCISSPPRSVLMYSIFNSSFWVFLSRRSWKHTILLDCIDKSYLLFDYLGNNCVMHCVTCLVDEWAKASELRSLSTQSWLSMTDTTFVQNRNLTPFSSYLLLPYSFLFAIFYPFICNTNNTGKY